MNYSGQIIVNRDREFCDLTRPLGGLALAQKRARSGKVRAYLGDEMLFVPLASNTERIYSISHVAAIGCH